MHVLVLGAGWPPDVFIQQRLRALARSGVRVTVAGLEQQFNKTAFDVEGVERLPLLVPRDHSPRALARLASLAVGAASRGQLAGLASVARRHGANGRDRYAIFRLGLQLLSVQPDVVHFEWNQAAVDYEWLLDLCPCPSVISCRGRQVNIWPQMPGKEAYAASLRRTLQRAHAVHCVSAALRDVAVRCGLDASRARVVLTAVDTGFHSPGPARDAVKGPLRLVSTGGLIWRKGFEYVLLALARAVEAGCDASLDIVGQGSEGDRIAFTAAELGIADRVRLRGQLPQLEVRDLLRSCDVFVLGSLSEGIANVVVEAMSCGVPVVTTDCGGMREALTDGVEGYLVPTRDPAAMSRAIVRLGGDPDLRGAMGAAGRERVLRDFSLERQAREFTELYEEALLRFHTGTRQSLSGPPIEPSGSPADARPVNATRCTGTTRLRLLTVADLNWRSGIEWTLQAVALLRESGVEVDYRLVGEGSFLEAVSFARQELGMLDCVEIMRPGETSLEDELRRCDLFLLGAVADDAGHALRQAIAAGVPAVFTDRSEVGPAPGASACRIVPPRDPEAMAAAVNELTGGGTGDSRRPAEPVVLEAGRCR